MTCLSGGLGGSIHPSVTEVGDAGLVDHFAIPGDSIAAEASFALGDGTLGGGDLSIGCVPVFLASQASVEPGMGNVHAQAGEGLAGLDGD